MTPRLRSCLAATMLLACGCTDAPGTSSNPHTGVTVHRSGEVALARRPASSFHARAVAFSAADATRFAVLTRVVRGDGNFPAIESAWSFGQRLAYVKDDRRRIGCGTATGCLREEVGHLPFSPPAFETAARQNGLTVQLIGRRGTYTGHLPARAFREVLDRLDRGRPFGPREGGM